MTENPLDSDLLNEKSMDHTRINPSAMTVTAATAASHTVIPSADLTPALVQASLSPMPPSSFSPPCTFSALASLNHGTASAVDLETPILPSQLRKRHEQEQHIGNEDTPMRFPPQQQRPQPRFDLKTGGLLESESMSGTDKQNDDKEDDDEELLALGNARGKTLQGISPSDSLHELETFQDNLNDNDEEDEEEDGPWEGPSYHSSALIRAKSYSMFESSNKDRYQDSMRPYQAHPHPGNTSVYAQQQQQQPQPRHQSFTYGDMGIPEMPTRDWVKMQTRINSLELQVSHVSRTNLLLNQELDKVNGHLRRLTSEEGEGWRKEYEFLVQQVDLMHRQLQIAHSQAASNGQGASAGSGGRARMAGGAPAMTRQLHAEVQELTASLKNWQAAYQQADENYRRKCDGERVLKQTLQERETQLSTLVDKLTGYESEFRKSISNYEELMRLSSELEALEAHHPQRLALTDIADQDTVAHNDGQVPTINQSLSPEAKAPETPSSKEASTFPSATPETRCIDEQKHMPGTFPEAQTQPHQHAAVPNVDQLTVSILSWAALLATYIIS